MRSALVIITDELTHQPLQMTFIQHDDMVDQISSAIPNSTLSNTVLPRASETSLLGLNTETVHPANDLFIEVRGAVED
jgi:hypothetical protein